MVFNTYVNKKYTDEDVEMARYWLKTELDKAILCCHDPQKMSSIREAIDKSGGSQLASRYGLDANITFADSELIIAYKRKKRAIEYLEYRYDFKYYPRNHIVREFPLVVAVEASSICNLRCKMCFQKNMDKQITPQNKGIMTYELYEKFLNEIEQNKLYSIVFASRGEPLLNPNIDKMIAAAKARGVLDIKLNTNAVLLTDDLSRRLLSSGLDMIVFSVDSIDNDHYKSIRGTDLEIVINNINRFMEIRRKEFPDSNITARVAMVITSQFFERAEEEINRARQYWLERVDELSVKSENNFASVYEKGLFPETVHTCSLLWERVYLWQDGTVNPCDIDHLSTMTLGSISSGSTIRDIWTGEQLNQLRRKHLLSRSHIETICDHCVGY